MTTLPACGTTGASGGDILTKKNAGGMAASARAALGHLWRTEAFFSFDGHRLPSLYRKTTL
ncbi:hypothetical protein [Pseudomonas syringae group genomosp. 7]|uniref:hypothetical protein n=1 Tax=Pseudomonas syringae group genomosp. 7 TaxID=251699 RepID=UPI00376F9EE8